MDKIITSWPIKIRKKKRENLKMQMDGPTRPFTF